jgi:hypothetical protein
VAISVADPGLGNYLARRTWRGSERQLQKLEAPGKRKNAMTPALRAGLEAKELVLFGPPVTDTSIPSEQTTSHKKRRVTSDRAIVIAAPAVATDSRTRSSRTRSQAQRWCVYYLSPVTLSYN